MPGLRRSLVFPPFKSPRGSSMAGRALLQCWRALANCIPRYSAKHMRPAPSGPLSETTKEPLCRARARAKSERSKIDKELRARSGYGVGSCEDFTCLKNDTGPHLKQLRARSGANSSPRGIDSERRRADDASGRAPNFRSTSYLAENQHHHLAFCPSSSHGD